MSDVDLRPIAKRDLPFLRDVYRSVRRDEIAMAGWSDQQIDQFLDSQFEAQHSHYVEHLQPADFLIIEREGEPVGRLYLGRWDDEIRLIDIALLPEHRNQGIGSELVRKVLAEAANSSIPVRLHVEPFNPALRLYERLGFQIVEERGVYLFMEYWPDGVS